MPDSPTRKRLASFSFLSQINWEVWDLAVGRGRAQKPNPFWREVGSGGVVWTQGSGFGPLFRWGFRHTIRPRWFWEAGPPPNSASRAAGLQLPRWQRILDDGLANLSPLPPPPRLGAAPSSPRSAYPQASHPSSAQGSVTPPPPAPSAQA